MILQGVWAKVKFERHWGQCTGLMSCAYSQPNLKKGGGVPDRFWQGSG